MEIYPKKPIRIASKQELDKEMRRIQQLFKKGESEDTWEAFTLALRNISLWTQEDNASQYEGFVDHFKLLQQSIIKSLTTERTRLSGTATELLKTTSQVMQRDYEPIHDLFGPTLIRTFARTNKVMYTRALDCYKTMIDNAKLPKLIPKLCNILKAKKEPSKSVRQCVAACLDQLIKVNDVADIQPHTTSIESVLRMNAMDSAPEVRLAVRDCYKTYCTRFPESASRFEEQLPPDIKKYLHVTTKPSKRPSLSSIPKLPAKPTKPRIAPRPKARYSAPQPAMPKQPVPQRPSASASLATKARPAPSTKPASVSSTKPASVSSTKPASVSSTKPASVSSSKPASVSSSKPASVLSSKPDPFSLLMRPTASSAQKSRTVDRLKKGFILKGMEPFQPVKRALSDGVENKRPTKKPTTEPSTQ